MTKKVRRVDELVKSLDEFAHVFVDLDALWRRTDVDMPEQLAADPTAVVGMRGSYARLLELIPAEGARPSAVAEAAGITKQAVGERLRELLRLELLDSTPDPADGRAVLLRLTDKGERARESTRRAVAGMELSWADQVGTERYAAFRSVLAELAQGHRSSRLSTPRTQG